MNAGQWATNIGNGNVQGLNLNPADPRFQKNTKALNKIHPGKSASFRNTTVSTNVPKVNGLNSKFATPADKNKKTIGAWSYIGPDPDYTNFVFSMNVFLTQVGTTAGFDMVTFALIDDNDLVKAWGWDTSRLQVGNSVFNMALRQGAGAGGSTLFYEDIGFDLTHVTMLQGSFEGTLTDTFPPIDGTGDELEAGTHSLAVAPEGDSLWLFAGGLVGVAVLARRRRAASV